MQKQGFRCTPHSHMVTSTITKNDTCLCEENTQHRRSKGRRGSQVVIVCRRSAEGQSMAEQQLYFPLSLPLLSPPPLQSNVVQSDCVSADWLSPFDFHQMAKAAAYEQYTARINSPSALHLNHSGANQRRGGALSSSTSRSRVYFTRREFSLTSLRI